ncbi:snapalysin family zinc-dependent metalloprotease [Pseudonocardiaceae bacterium YIM PH 21723]|nr:snapalysin family zinc-dependent metalloprotease [Pseudonocardiaceae bacterium YIM PH 21723]
MRGTAVFRRAAFGAVAALTLALTAVTAPASAAPLVTTLTYDNSQAAEFKDAVDKGMEVWNTNAKNVKIVKVTPGQRANITIIADDSWPHAELGPVRANGSVTWWFGRQASNYNHVRIAAHETGHSLGLPDMKPGPCSSLMSGSTGGVDCANVNPNASELSRVENNYAGTAATNTHVLSAAY